MSSTLHASQQKVVVHSLGITSIEQAQQPATAARFASSGQPRAALPVFPNPRLRTGVHALSTVNANGQNSELPVVGADSGEHGFSGINTSDSNNANGGGLNGIGEPPDQGLATNGSQVFEAVNSSFRIFSNSGQPLTTNIGFPAFFGVPPSNGSSSNSLTDPRVFFDPQSNRFFVSILEYQSDNTTGAFVGSQDLLAVSQTSDATGNYYLYSIDVSLSGDPACVPACLGDQPLIGSNDDGFYFSNNEYTNSSSTPFAGALLIGLNKEALINNTPANGVAYLLPNDFSVEPALPAPGAVTTQHNGTEYFTESLDFGPPGGNTLRIFALTHTDSLEHTLPTTNLMTSDFPSESYSPPTPANQKAGSYPLGQHFGEPEELLSTNDDRMLQLYYANGKLYTTLETELVDTDDSLQRSGAAWFEIEPQTTSTTVSAHVVHQGYIGISHGSVLFPAFAVNDSGNGVIGFTYSGTKYFPSAGYVHFSDGSVEQKVHTAGAGQNPEDGFTGYTVFGGNGVSRWGDYSSAAVAPDGDLWFATEYIPNDIQHPRTQYTNWGTFVSRVQ